MVVDVQMVSEKSRYLFDRKRSILIVCNFKVGFSSLNSGKVVQSLGFDTSIKNAFQLRKAAQENGIICDYRKFLIVRNPVDRYLSFYFNWVVNKEYDFVDAQGNINHGYRILKDVTSAKAFQEFVMLSKEERATEEALHFYTSHLPDLYMSDGHIQPQHLIYSEAGLCVDFFQEVVPIKDMDSFIFKEFGLRLPRNNRTTPKKAKLASNYVKKVCEEIYKKDYLDFGMETTRASESLHFR